MRTSWRIIVFVAIIYLSGECFLIIESPVCYGGARISTGGIRMRRLLFLFGVASEN